MSSYDFDSKVQPAEIQSALDPLGERLRALAQQHSSQDPASDQAEQARAFEARVSGIGTEPLYDYAFAAELRQLAAALRESTIREALSEDLGNLDRLSNMYQNQAAFNKGI